MKIYIDQSGKVEQTNNVTVLAYCNGIYYSVVIPAKTKRKIQELFRKSGMTRLFVHNLFAVGIYFLLEKFNQKISIVIDKEYPEKEKIILSILQRLLEDYNKPIHNVNFLRIGNSPKVHYVAHDVFTKKTQPGRILRYTELIGVLKKTDGRLRECFSTLVDAQPRPLNKKYHGYPIKSRLIKKR